MWSERQSTGSNRAKMPFLQTLLHHPRKLLLRRALFQVHLWAGVLLSLYVVVIALTGSVLVFRTELTKAMLPKELSIYDASQAMSIEEVLQKFQLAYPGATLQNLQTPSPRMPAYLLTAREADGHGLTFIADPLTARLWAQPRTWLDWIYDLHVYLLLGHAFGIQVNGLGAVILLLLTFSGIFLWWSGFRTWMRGLGVDFRRNWRRINFDLHSAIGFWTLLIVFWWGLSGVYFAWYRQVTSVVACVSPLRGMISPSSVPLHGVARVSMRQILATVQEASPGGHLFSLSDPMLSGESTYALVDLREPGDFSHRDILQISTVDGRLLSTWHYGQNHSAGDWFLWAMHPLHFGTLWGIAFKVLWAGLGVALAGLSITGLLMYWNRFLRHRLSRYRR
jgi:uncharacterized iron-regulated membrane protein